MQTICFKLMHNNSIRTAEGAGTEQERCCFIWTSCSTHLLLKRSDCRPNVIWTTSPVYFSDVTSFLVGASDVIQADLGTGSYLTGLHTVCALHSRFIRPDGPQDQSSVFVCRKVLSAALTQHLQGAVCIMAPPPLKHSI